MVSKGETTVETTWRLNTVLAVAAYIYRMNGNTWSSESDAAARDVPSSASAVVAALTDPKLPIPSVTASDVRTARDARDWLLTIARKKHATPYERKLSAILIDLETVPLDLVGKVATAIPAYKDGRKKHASKEWWSKLNNSKHVSEFVPGDFTVVRSNPHTIHINKGGSQKSINQTQLILVDENGNGYKWFDSKCRPYSIGQKVKINRAKIAGKDAFNGVKLTKINYVSVAV